MVRVFKCHSFASQQVVPVEKEPLSIYAVDDKIFVATVECEIIVYKVLKGTSSVIKTLPSISQVHKILYNRFRNYIVTVELKKSWKRVTHSARVYLNWESGSNTESKSRTKVRVAGRSHVQHVSALPDPNLMDIIEVPVDCYATSIDVCRLTGNFAVACGQEVKLCSIVEKTVANTDRTYLDVEVFLELCWNFTVISISLCEEFVICSSKNEVQGIKLKYVERQHSNGRAIKHSSSHSSLTRRSLVSKDSSDNLHTPSAGVSPQSVISDTFVYPENFGELSKEKDLGAKAKSRFIGIGEAHQDLSHVGTKSNGGAHGSLPYGAATPLPSEPVNDDYFEEWNFNPADGCSGSHTLCLSKLQSKITLAHCHHQTHKCPRVVPNSAGLQTGGNGKSNSGVDIETVIYLNESQNKEEWISVQLVPTHLAVPSPILYSPPSSTDRLKSCCHSSRVNMCCYVSNSRGGFLFQLSPVFMEISSYKFSDKAAKVCCGESHLHVATNIGIETYTSRWAALALESLHSEDNDEHPLLQVHPPAKLDICLCGHEPFMGVVDLSVGNDFLSLLSKVQDFPGSDECAWSLYIIHCFSLKEQFEEMMQFAEAIQHTGPASYIHLLQEAHLLISTNILFSLRPSDDEIQACLQRVCRNLGDYYAQPDQESWRLCSAYYKSLNVSADILVAHARSQTTHEHSKHPINKHNYGLGIIDYLDWLLFSDADDSLLPTKDSATHILEIFYHSAPEKLSKIILLSRLQGYKSEAAFKYLKDVFDDRSATGQFVSTIDKLAMTQLHLDMCEVEMAQSQQDSISRSELIHVCVQHPNLIKTAAHQFTPLAQLLRHHRSATLLEILVEMLDECVMSLDSLLILLKNQDEVDMLHNSHIKQILELVLTDEKRVFLFESVATHLCEIYLTQISEGRSSAKVPRHITQGSQYKFSLPQGNGYFAQRFSWLDELPPFMGADRMVRPCRRLEMKHVPGSQGSQTMSKVSEPLDGAKSTVARCPCCQCNENLLKLQSLLCSQHISEDLAHHILEHIGTQKNDSDDAESLSDSSRIEENSNMDDIWDSIILLCEIKIDLKTAMQRIIDKYPYIAAIFASTCLNGNSGLYSDLMRRLEKVIKNCATNTASNPHSEEVNVKSYKALLNKASQTFTPSQFVELLPSDGKVVFFLPYLVHNLELEHMNSLKCKIVDLGSELLTYTN